VVTTSTRSFNNQKIVIAQLVSVCNNGLGLGLGHGSRFGVGTGGRGMDDLNTNLETGIAFPRVQQEQDTCSIFTEDEVQDTFSSYNSTLNPIIQSPIESKCAQSSNSSQGSSPSSPETLPSPRTKNHGSFICPYNDCNNRFSSQISLKRHIKRHTLAVKHC